MIRFSKKFKKQYQKLPAKYQQQFIERLQLWQEQPYHPLLNNHKLSGKLSDFYSININADLRALYQVVGDDIYIYQLIGTHSQLYG